MINPSSQEFSEVRRRCEELIEVARAQLEQRDLPTSDTDFLRGRINAMREIIAMGEPSPIDQSKRFDAPARLGDRSGIM